MPPSKKATSPSGAPKSFRTNPASEVALEALKDFVKSKEGKAPSVSDLINDLIRAKFLELKKSGELPEDTVDPYMLFGLVEGMRKKIPLKGERTASGRQQLVDQLSVADISELIDLGLLLEPETLADSGGAVSVDRYTEAKTGALIDSYETRLGYFNKRHLGESKHEWFFEPDVLDGDTTSDHRLTEEDIKSGEVVATEGSSGYYWNKIKTKDGRFSWVPSLSYQFRLSNQPVTERESEDDDCELLARGDFKIQHGEVRPLLPLLKSICMPREADILEYAFASDDVTLAEVEKKFGITPKYSRRYLFGALRKLRLISMQYFISDALTRFQEADEKTAEKLESEQVLTRTLFPQSTMDREDSKFLARWIREIAADLVRSGEEKGVFELTHESKMQDGELRRVYRFNPETFARPTGTLAWSVGVLGEWDIHWSRGPHEPSGKYSVKPVIDSSPKTPVDVIQYDNYGSIQGQWTEFNTGEQFLSLLRLEDGEIFSYRLESRSHREIERHIFSQYTRVRDAIHAEGHNPTLGLMAKELNLPVGMLKAVRDRMNTARNRNVAYYLHKLESSHWVNGEDIKVDEEGVAQFKWQAPDSSDRPLDAEKQEALILDDRTDHTSCFLPYQLVNPCKLVRAYLYKLIDSETGDAESCIIARFRWLGRASQEEVEMEDDLQFVDVGPIPTDGLGRLLEKVSRLSGLYRWFEGDHKPEDDGWGAREDYDRFINEYAKEYDYINFDYLSEAIEDAAVYTLSDRNSYWLKFLDQVKGGSLGQVVKEVSAYAAEVTKDKKLLGYIPDQPVTRNDVAAFCEDRSNPTEACVLLILAWMGHRIDHTKKIWSHRKYWEPSMTKFRRSNDFGRQPDESGRDFYEELQALRRFGRLPGVRPATYTAFIHFLCGNKTLPIMGQWISKSVNIIARMGIVNLTDTGYVSDDNDGERYMALAHYLSEMVSAVNKGKKLDDPTRVELSDIEEAMRGKGIGDDPNDTSLVINDWRKFLEKAYPQGRYEGFEIVEPSTRVLHEEGWVEV